MQLGLSDICYAQQFGPEAISEVRRQFDLPSDVQDVDMIANDPGNHHVVTVQRLPKEQA